MRKLSILVLAFPFVASHSSAAQAPVPTMPWPVIGLGGGVSIPPGGFAKDRHPGCNLDGMVELWTPSAPRGLRGEVLYQYFGKDQNAVNSTSANTVAFLVNVVYHAPKSQELPYLIGGMGLYHISHNGNNAGFNVGRG